MQQIPTLELRVRDFGEQVRSIITLHQQEIQQYLEQGVERAVAGIGNKLIDEAITLATQKIHEEVKHYLLYGAGGKDIRVAVHHALAPRTSMLPVVPGQHTLALLMTM